jgi:hypothetical protein
MVLFEIMHLIQYESVVVSEPGHVRAMLWLTQAIVKVVA